MQLFGMVCDYILGQFSWYQALRIKHLTPRKVTETSMLNKKMYLNKADNKICLNLEFYKLGLHLHASATWTWFRDHKVKSNYHWFILVL